MSNSLGEAVLDLTADNTPLKESVGDSKSFIESALGTLGGVAKGVLAAGIGVAAGAFGVLTGALGVCVSEAMEGEAVVAQLDAVLRSTGEAAAQQAQAWEDAQGKFVTSTALSSEELVGLQDELGRAQAKLTDMQTAWDKTDEHTEMAAIRLQDAKDKVAELSAAIAAGGQTITTSLADSMGLVPPVAQMSKEALLDLADGLTAVTRFSDDAIISGEAMLLTFTNIGADVFPDTTKTMLDMAQAMGTDLKSTAIQLGKALNSPKDGLTALTRVGVTFTEEQKKLVTSLQDSGDLAGAQRVILAELQKEFGGSAEAAGKTFAGQLDILKNRLLNVAEGIGSKLLPIGQSLMDKFILPALPAIEYLGEGVAAMFDALMGGEDISGAFDVLSGFVNDVLPGSGEAVRDFGDTLQNVFDTVTGAMKAFGTGFAEGGLVGGIAGMLDSLSSVNPVFGTLSGAVVGLSNLWTNTLQPALLSTWSWIQTNLLPLLTNLWSIISTQGATSIGILLSWWTGHLWPDLQALWGWVQVNLLPLLDQLWTWFATNLPIAIQTLGNFWNTTLLPALLNFTNWYRANVGPLLAELWAWLQTNIPLAIQTLSGFWTGTLQPAIASVSDWITGTLVPVLSNIWTWLSTNVPAALTTLSTFWTSTLLPAITSVWDWMSGTLLPFFESLADFLNAAFTLALTAMAGLWDKTILPAIKDVWQFLDANVFPIFRSIAEYLNANVTPALTTFGSYISDTLMRVIGDLVDGVLTDLSGIWAGISEGIKGVTEWLQTMADKLNAMDLPDWLTPGSPTPFENGLRGIASALDQVAGTQLPNFAASLQIQPVGVPAMAMAGAGVGNGSGSSLPPIHIHIGQVNDPVDVEMIAYRVVEEIHRHQ